MLLLLVSPQLLLLLLLLLVVVIVVANVDLRLLVPVVIGRWLCHIECRGSTVLQVLFHVATRGLLVSARVSAN